MRNGRPERSAGLRRRMRLNGIKDKKVTVVGLAKSGVGAANMLAELGAQVTVTDIKPEERFRSMFSNSTLLSDACLGTHPAEIFLGADMLIVSPGVPLDIGPLSCCEGQRNPGNRRTRARLSGSSEGLR